MDYLREMALFVEVAKARSFRRASEATGVPSSSLSRRIAELERAVGARLLNRTTRIVELTEAGAIYFARCREIVDAARIAHEQLGEMIEKPRGRLRVSATAEFARLFLGPLIDAYTRRYPEVTLELDLSPGRVDLVSQNYDLALRIGEQPDSGLIARRLGLIRTALYAAPAYLARQPAPNVPAELVGHAVVRNPNVAKSDQWTLSDGVHSEDVVVSGQVLVNNFGFMRQLAVLGHGIVMLHEPMALADVRAGRLERILPGWWLREVPALALTPSRLLPAKTRLFLAMLIEEVGPQLDIPRTPNVGGFIPPTAQSFPSREIIPHTDQP